MRKIQCADCGAQVYFNSISGEKLTLHPRKSPVWIVGDRNQLQMHHPGFVRHVCGHPVVAGDEAPLEPLQQQRQEATDDVVLDVVRGLAVRIGLADLKPMPLEDTVQSITALVTDYQQEIEDLKGQLRRAEKRVGQLERAASNESEKPEVTTSRETGIGAPAPAAAPAKRQKVKRS